MGTWFLYQLKRGRQATGLACYIVLLACFGTNDLSEGN